MLFCEKTGGWEEMFAVTLNTASREEEEVAQLEYRCDFALARIKRKCPLQH